MISGRKATQEAVLDRLGQAKWLHVASHGIQDTRQPLDSGLLLADGRLKLSTLIRQCLDHGEMAFLSACETGMGDQTLAGESIHLAAGFLHAGVSSVVAMMWVISDRDGPVVAERIYK